MPTNDELATLLEEMADLLDAKELEDWLELILSPELTLENYNL